MVLNGGLWASDVGVKRHFRGKGRFVGKAQERINQRGSYLVGEKSTVTLRGPRGPILGGKVFSESPEGRKRNKGGRNSLQIPPLS